MRLLASSQTPYGILSRFLFIILLHSVALAQTTPASHSGSSTTGSTTGSIHESPTSTASSESNDIVDQALKVLAVVNKARVEYPVFNQKKREDPDEDKPAPLLNYKANVKSLSSDSRLFGGDNDTSHGSYRIPKDLAEAAASIAESTSQIPKGDHEDVAARIRKKYSPDSLNDTNAPDEQQAPEGRLSVFAGDAPKDKRASGYWMVDDQKFPGKSPFSPDGYQVWRNVKDFGAKGDGKTDDTVAINKAISDGARCGEKCKTSTIAPAVVYFPPGTYLVSGSIIQYYNTQFLGDVR